MIALVAGQFGLLGAVGAVESIWGDVQKDGWGRFSGAAIVVGAFVVLAAVWRWLSESRSRAAAPRWAGYMIFAATFVAVSSVVLLAVSALTKPVDKVTPPPPPPPTPTMTASVTGTTTTSATTQPSGPSPAPPTTRPSRRPPTAPTTRPPGPPTAPAARVTWQSPRPDEEVRAGVDPVTLRGHVSGLPPGHTVWVVSHPPDPTSNYFIVQGGPVGTGEGDFYGTDSKVGDVTDPHGSGYRFVAVDADTDCSEQLTRISDGSRSRGDTSYRIREELVAGCHLLKPEVIVLSR